MEIKQEKQQVEPKPETAKFFQCLLSASIDGILVTDETQNIIVANEPFCSFFGQVPVNMLETNLLDWLKRVHEDCVRDWTEVDKNAHLKGSCQNIEFKMILPHETRFFSINASILERLHGKESCILSMWHDSTGIKLAKEKLRMSEIKFHTICASAHDAIIMIDNEGRVSYWNEAAEKMFGRTSKEVTGKEIHELIMPERFRKRHQEGFKAFQDTGAGPVVGKTVELAALRKDGNEFPVELSLSAIKIRTKWQAVGIIRDITERRQSEERLKRHIEELERFKNATIQREIRMKELRDRVEELEKEI